MIRSSNMSLGYCCFSLKRVVVLFFKQCVHFGANCNNEWLWKTKNLHRTNINQFLLTATFSFCFFFLLVYSCVYVCSFSFFSVAYSWSFFLFMCFAITVNRSIQFPNDNNNRKLSMMFFFSFFLLIKFSQFIKGNKSKHVCREGGRKNILSFFSSVLCVFLINFCECTFLSFFFLWPFPLLFCLQSV